MALWALLVLDGTGWPMPLQAQVLWYCSARKICKMGMKPGIRFWNRSRPIPGLGPKILELVEPVPRLVPKILDLVGPGLGPSSKI